MERIDEVRSKLRIKKQEYQSLRDDYAIIMQNLKTNMADKKAMRKEIAELTKEFRELKKSVEDIDTGTDSLL